MARRSKNVFEEVPELEAILATLPAPSERSYRTAFDDIADADPTRAAILGHGFVLAARFGLDSITLSELCTRARIGRATLYRRWANLDEYRSELIRLSLASTPPSTSTGTLDNDIRAWHRGALPWLSHRDARQLILNLIYAISTHALVGEDLRRETTSVRRAGAGLFEVAIERGEVDHHADVDLLAATLLGPSLLLLLVERRPPTEAELDFQRAFLRSLASQEGPPLADWTGVDRSSAALFRPILTQIQVVERTDPQRASVLRATMQLLLVDGITSLTSDLVAAKAEVSKSTIYERWENMDALVGEFTRTMIMSAPRPPESDSAFAEMQHWLGRVPVWSASAPVVSAMATMFHQAAADDSSEHELQLGRVLWQMMVRDVIERAAARGQVDTAVDPTNVLYALIGPMMQLILCGEVVSEDRVARLIRAAIDQFTES